MHGFVCAFVDIAHWSLLNSFVSSSASLISLPAAFPLSVLSVQHISILSAIITSSHLVFFSHGFTLLDHLIAVIWSPFLSFSSVFVYLSPSHHPASLSFLHISFIRPDYNSWCKCHGVTMLKVTVFVCAVADLIND